MIKSFIRRYSFARNKRMIAGNWKCNKTLYETSDFIKYHINTLKYNPKNVDVIIAPVALHIMSLVLYDHEKKYKIAAQNASGYNFGAYTGEISSKHLKEVGVSWVILGHSERRTLFGETDDIVVGKTKLAIENKLKVIFCFGYTLEERNADKTWTVLDSQLTPLLKAFPGDSYAWPKNIVLAYEPVWAIGTGVNSSPEQTKEVFDWLRKRLSKDIPNSDKIRILYGGSATAKNAKDYLNIQSVDGLLVGGASLKPEFADIVKAGDYAV